MELRGESPNELRHGRNVQRVVVDAPSATTSKPARRTRTRFVIWRLTKAKNLLVEPRRWVRVGGRANRLIERDARGRPSLVGTRSAQ